MTDIQNQLEEKFEQLLREDSFVQYDERYKRYTVTRVGCSIEIKNLTHLSYLKAPRSDVLFPKYSQDQLEMEYSLAKAIEEAKRDHNSRQIVILNTDSFFLNFPCFLTIQFLKTAPGRGLSEFSCVVYQRSADKEKFHDDLCFFGGVMRTFERLAAVRVTRLIIFYGSLHKTREEEKKK